MPTATAPAARKTAAATSGRIVIRRLLPTDSMEALTTLLHRAYAGQIVIGLRPLAGRQDPETTARRCTSGECYVAVLTHEADPASDRDQSERHSASTRNEASSDNTTPPLETSAHAQLVGTILFHEVEDAKGPPWFARSDVDSFSQFAVDPDLQGYGIGRLLLETVERRAAECGARELGLSMAEADTALMQFYLRRGYRLIEHWVWPYTNYRSAILSKTLNAQ